MLVVPYCPSPTPGSGTEHCFCNFFLKRLCGSGNGNEESAGLLNNDIPL